MRTFAFLFFMFIASAWGISDNFTFTLDSDESALKNMVVYINDGSVYIGSSETALTGQIKDDGSIKLDDAEFIGITKNYFTVENTTTEAAVQFSINGKGLLQYNGEKKFKAIPSGSSNIWILASSDASSSLSSAYEIQIKCKKSNGKNADEFNNFGTKATVQYGILISCMLFATFLTV